MHIIIKNDLTEVAIEISEEKLPDIEDQLRSCLVGNFTYIDFEDTEGNKHFFTLEYLKKSHVRII